MIAPKAKKSNKVGAALVIGGGIAGIQASLDLADSGQKVYLVTDSPAIGGNMPRLDKTFPTNDCSMCILSPKLVEAGRHLNIELLTYSDVEGVTGEPGSFEVSVNRRARYVDGEKCTGCGLCVAACPVQYAVYEEPKQEVPIQLEAEELGTVNAILGKHRGQKGNLIPILKEINAGFNYLPQNILRHTARELDMPLSVLYRIATFYSAFSLTPRGRHIIRICLGTTCYVRGSGKLLARLKKELQVGVGEATPDMRYSLETVRCLGCCSLSPVMAVDGDTYGKVKEREIAEVLAQYE